MRRVAIIMAGGAGERFWPISRQHFPKQLLKFGGDSSMLGAAVDRVRPLVDPADVFVITSRALKPAIEADVSDLPANNVIAEPEGKNTAACLALAVAYIAARYADEADLVMIVLTADHHVRDVEAFTRDCKRAIKCAENQNVLLTFGIQPTRAETGYGYIEAGDAIEGCPDVLRVKSFREKPNLETAERFLEQKIFLWNSGMFVWRNSVLWSAFATHLPEAHAAIDPMRAACAKSDEGALAAAFNALPKISIDIGVLEKARNVGVVRASFDWDDIGTWNSVTRLFEPDAEGNVTFGKSTLLRCRNSTAYSVGADGAATQGKEPPIVIGYELEDTIIVRTPDAVLVLPASAAQGVKDVVAHLREHGLSEYL